MDKHIELELGKISDELKKVTRRINDLQKSVDLLYKDREILEDLQGSVRKLQELQLNARQHSDTVAQDIKFEIKDSQIKTEDKIEEKVEQAKEDIVKGIGG